MTGPLVILGVVLVFMPFAAVLGRLMDEDAKKPRCRCARCSWYVNEPPRPCAYSTLLWATIGVASLALLAFLRKKREP